MRHIMKKIFFVWDFDKEEKWLNEMAAKGLCLVSVGFCRYEFEDCLPGEYTIRMELLEKSPKKPESRKYIEFLEETGAEQVGAFSNWVFFRKKTAEGTFELFSDFDSRIKHLKRIVSTLTLVTVANLIIGIDNIFLFFMDSFLPNALGFVNLLIGLWGVWGTRRIYKKKKKLEKDKQIFE